jgi:signal transduction histidine kinase
VPDGREDDAADGAEVGEGMGLPGMRDRLAAVGGALRTERTARGYVLTATIPREETA